MADNEFTHAKFSGLRNTVKNHRFALEDLEVATNVDVDESQELLLRYGFGALVVSGVYKSLWSDNSIALAVKSQTNLMRVMPNWSEVVLRTGLTPGLDMSYTSANGSVFYSNGVDKGAVQNGASRTWGIDIPSGQPVAEAIGGLLKAGRYQFAVTFMRNDGQESGTPVAAFIDLTVDGGIRLSGISVSNDPGVTSKVLYFTKVNGKDLYRVGIIDNDDTAFDYQLEASMQVPLNQDGLDMQHLRPPPAGQFIDSMAFNRALVASGNTLYYSEPYALELFNLRKNYQFQGRITMIAALESGAYVGTDQGIVWLNGAVPERWEYNPKKDYASIPGALAFCTRDMVLEGQGDKLVAVFGTEQGFCMGEDGGNITNLTQSRYLYSIQDRGAMVVRRHRGMTQCLTVFQGTERAANIS